MSPSDSTYVLSRYKTEKVLPVNKDWKIVLNSKDSTFIVISEISTKSRQEKKMFGDKIFCDIDKWKVNGIQYSIDNGDKFIQAKKFYFAFMHMRLLFKKYDV